ncbi:MAG: CRISPR-associated endonuclease Cas2 [Candidatus Omnitrophica bacterium]|nr:CRISPR-associated endonuclease Cas2 [Candidatus Omnitrophota bacterium]
MYIVVVYDVAQSRVAKMCKTLRTYLNWVQNSVFEGEITKGKLAELKSKLNKIMDKEVDSLIIYRLESNKWIQKEVIGKEFNPTDNVL